MTSRLVILIHQLQVWGEGEVGIDGIAIIVNDVVISTLQEVESIFTGEQSGKPVRDISVSFVFTQSKTSERFELNEYSHFLSAVYDFANNGNLNHNNKAKELQKAYKYIIDHPTQLFKNPNCYIVYAYAGDFEPQESATNITNLNKGNLERLSRFDDVGIHIYDSRKITSICRSIKNSVEKSVCMDNCSVLPHIDNVSEAFIGTVKCKDYVKLITNDDELLISNLFEDNVRYFQGHNKVNSEIQATIMDFSQQQAFSILNNGVTIIAEDIRRTANSFVLKNFQIVNGCQTSFVLYENKKNLSEDSYIVVKLISSKDKKLADSIVKTTNRQTPITDEAFETLREFHKNLENVYSSYNVDYRLFYERRSKQYEATDINKSRIVSFPFQTKAYVAMFMGEPQSTHRYYGELLSSNKSKIYREDDVLEQYCVASMYVFFIEKYLVDNNFVSYKKYKYHISLLCRLLVNKQKLPRGNSGEMKKLCNELLTVLENQKTFGENVEKAIKIIDDTLAQETQKYNGNEVSRTRFTESIVGQLGIQNCDFSIDRNILPLEEGNKFKCKVTGWNRSFAYVEIIDYKESGSIYIGKITGKYIFDISEELRIGQIVDAKIIDNVPDPVYGYEMSMI